LNKPNKIYLLSPIIGNDENPEPYLDPDTDYNPEKTPDYGYDSEHIENCTSGDIHSLLPTQQELYPRTLKNYTAGSTENEPPKLKRVMRRFWKRRGKRNPLSMQTSRQKTRTKRKTMTSDNRIYKF
jgi:hypothetical protein